MKLFFYIIINDNLGAFNIGTTNRLELIYNAIEREFGPNNKEKSAIYSSDNAKLIENINNGCIAFLDGAYAEINTTSETSKAWFKIEALNKLMTFIDMYIQEVDSFKFIDTYASWEENEKPKIATEVSSSYDVLFFLNSHTTAIDVISKWITVNKINLVYVEANGFNILKGADTKPLINLEAPFFKWFIVDENEMKFDLNAFNDWEKSGIETAIKELVKIKFFDKFSLKNLDVMFPN